MPQLAQVELAAAIITVLAFVLVSVLTRRIAWNHYVVVAGVVAGGTEAVFDQLSRCYAVGLVIWAFIFIEVSLAGLVNSHTRFAKAHRKLW